MSKTRLVNCLKKWSGSPLGPHLNRGTDKADKHSYDSVYGLRLPEFEKKDIDILEVGVCKGGSLACWSEYFSNANSITGIDINKFDANGIDNKNYEKIKENVTIYNEVSSLDKKRIDQIFKNRNFDIIIDDGSHNYSDQIVTFNILFPRLRKGGLYFIEDVEGEESLKEIKSYFHESNFKLGIVNFYDLRDKQQRWDDIIVCIEKSCKTGG